MGTVIDYRTNFTRAKNSTNERSSEHDALPRRLVYARSWRRAAEARKPHHRRTNRWWW